MNQTEKRKSAHVDIALKKKVEGAKCPGFEDIEFIHAALPEVDLGKIDTRCMLFKKELAAPIVIEGMTGGYRGAEKINKSLAKAAQQAGIAFGLGSQRAMLENPRLAATYKVRDVAPDALIIGNIGIVQLREYSIKKIDAALREIGADALAVHLNALQEAVQLEGDRNFEGCLVRIEKTCAELSLPVLVKETGAGISREIAIELERRGVAAIDVAGAGGTSWAAVESMRGAMHEFNAWGIPTAVSTAEVARAVKIPVIASGGIRSGIDVAKVIALGAGFGGAALPFIRLLNKGGERALHAAISAWKAQLRIAMFLTGSVNIAALGRARILITGRTAEMLRLRGIEPHDFAGR